MYNSALRAAERDLIESRLDYDRAALQQSIKFLGNRLSAPSLALEAFGAMKGEALPYLRALGGAVRANPLPFAIAGAGLAWLLFGRKPHSTEPLREALARWEDEGGPVGVASIRDDRWISEIDQLRMISMQELNGIDADAINQLIPPKQAAAARERVLSDLAEDVRGCLRHGLGRLPAATQEKIATAREAFYMTRIS